MSGYIAVFAYDFPHQKSCDFIKDLFSYGLKNLVVFAAPKKDLSYLSRPKAAQNLSNVFTPLETRELCNNLGVIYYAIGHDDVSQLKPLITKHSIDMGIIAGARIISPEIISMFSEGIVNFHPGKIPETSGLDAFAYTLKKGVPAGVTTHFIDHRVDAGDFIRFNQVSVQTKDTLTSIQENIYQLQRKALQDFCADYISSNITTQPINRPNKNAPMNQEERDLAFSLFERWKAKQLINECQATFYYDCEFGNINDVIEKLVFDPSLVYSTNEKGWSPLIVACFNQQYEVVKLLLNNGANPNRCGASGTTPLMYAKTKILNQETPDLSLIKLLIDAGADCLRTDCHGKDLFFYIDMAGDKRLAASIKEYINK